MDYIGYLRTYSKVGWIRGLVGLYFGYVARAFDEHMVIRYRGQGLMHGNEFRIAETIWLRQNPQLIANNESHFH